MSLMVAVMKNILNILNIYPHSPYLLFNATLAWGRCPCPWQQCSGMSFRSFQSKPFHSDFMIQNAQSGPHCVMVWQLRMLQESSKALLGQGEMSEPPKLCLSLIPARVPRAKPGSAQPQREWGEGAHEQSLGSHWWCCDSWVKIFPCFAATPARWDIFLELNES